jgi:hypothetical protein
MKIGWAVALLVGLAVPSFAQEAPAKETPSKDEKAAARDEKALDSSELDEEPVSARRPLRVLRHPYELSSFYRSGDQRGFEGDASINPYALPNYYRSAPPSGGYGYEGAFGIGGMQGYGPMAPTAPRRRYVRRPLGHNGEWWLLAPGFLAPIGPLTGADWSR